MLESRTNSTIDEPLELTILLPCLNEAETLEPCIRKALSYLTRSGIRGEVLVADNGSTDGSQAIAARLGARVVVAPVRGYGGAVFEGARQSLGKYIVMGDADDSYDFSDLGDFLTQLRAGDDLVLGNRFLGEIKPGAMPWKNRVIGNPILSGIGRLLFPVPVGDFHCGLRGFSKHAFERMDLRTSGMEFASEMVIKASLLRMRMSEVPITLWPDKRSHRSHLRPWRDGWRHLRFMILYNPNFVFLYPGVLLLILGMVGGLWLLPGPRFVGSVVLDVHSLLYAGVAILVGYQGIMFAAFARIFAVTEGLAPEDAGLQRLFKFITLETGLIVGATLVATGAGATFWTFNRWRELGFGPLNVSVTLRAAIPAVVVLTLGVEVLLSSLFLSMVGLRLRRRNER